MTFFTRRDALQIGSGALAGTTMLGAAACARRSPSRTWPRRSSTIEAGASLRVLRPSKFVQGDETLFLENSKKFTDKTGVAGHGDQRELGGPAAEDGDRGGDRQRPGHRLRLVRRPAQVRGAVRRPHRPRRLSRREVWRLVADRREVRQEPDHRQVDRHAGRRLRQPLSSIASPGSTRRATRPCPSDLDGFLDMAQQAQGQRPPDRLRARQRRRRRQLLVPLADVDASAAR